MASTLNSAVKDFVIQKLREESPWMKTDAVQKAAVACGRLVDDKLREQYVLRAVVSERC